MHLPPRCPTSGLFSRDPRAWSLLLLPSLLAACTVESAANGTPPVSAAALPGPPGLPNPSATDPNPRGYGPTSTTGTPTGGGFGAGVGR